MRRRCYTGSFCFHALVTSVNTTRDITMKLPAVAAFILLTACSSQPANSSPGGPAHVMAATSVQAGEYIVRMSGCNGCHTPGWPQSGGKLPPSKWLTGSDVGYRGPWGTVYPVNVRLFASSIPRDAWIGLFKSAPPLPVMPFDDYGHGGMSDADVGAIYDFVVSLGRAGKPAPANISPGQTPRTAYMTLVPARGH